MASGSVLSTAKRQVDLLMSENHVADFAADTDRGKALRGGSLRALKAILDNHDPEDDHRTGRKRVAERFAGLRRVWADDGTAVWTKT